MNLNYFISDRGNFGDDLNPYIFHRLFPSCFTEKSDAADEIDFYGIGTVIDRRIAPDHHAVFFGTGIRDISLNYNKGKWDIFFLRGPISANVLSCDRSKAITDSAYLILFINEEIRKSIFRPKKYACSFIPHYRTMTAVDWDRIERLTGIHIIDPGQPVEHVLDGICHSEKILAHAMHGAIMSDICRIPWCRIRMSVEPYERRLVSEVKWNDWLLSMNLTDMPVSIDSFRIHMDKWMTPFIYKELTVKLKQAKTSKFFQLSEDSVLACKIDLLKEQTDCFKNKYMNHDKAEI
jgi:succinoglycan biosynthesis protein ExoV